MIPQDLRYSLKNRLWNFLKENQTQWTVKKRKRKKATLRIFVGIILERIATDEVDVLQELDDGFVLVQVNPAHHCR